MPENIRSAIYYGPVYRGSSFRSADGINCKDIINAFCLGPGHYNFSSLLLISMRVPEK